MAAVRTGQVDATMAIASHAKPAEASGEAKIIAWAAENVNNREELFFGAIDIDEDELREYLEKNADAGETATEEEGKERRAPRPFAESA